MRSLRLEPQGASAAGAAGRPLHAPRAPFGRRSGERLARRLLTARELEPRWTPARIAAYAIAIAVHLVTLALIAAGVAAIVIDFPNVLGILIGATLAGVGLLEGREAEVPRVVLNSAQSRRIDAELEPLTARIDHELLDAHRGRLYTG